LLNTVSVHGQAGTILRGGLRPAAWLRTWTIHRTDDQWSLAASIERVDTFQLRQTALAFTAPRVTHTKGFWYFPVLASSIRLDGQSLFAKLGPPEQ
jgi:hypothetical protein